MYEFSTSYHLDANVDHPVISSDVQKNMLRDPSPHTLAWTKSFGTQPFSSMPQIYLSSESSTETISGFAAGIVTTFVVHPLDLIKTRLQVDRASTSKIGSSARLAEKILNHEGGSRAFYRGFGPNLLGNSVSWALYFAFYDALKNGISCFRSDTRPLSYQDYFLASGIAGTLTTICTNPIWVIKTRMLSTVAGHTGAYSSVLEGIRQIMRHDGVGGFYRGLLPSLFGVSHGAVQFMIYEQMKNQKSNLNKGETLQNRDYLLFSGLSKILAGTLTYPYQVIRSRLQAHEAEKMYRGTSDVIAQILRCEGVLGLYKGLAPNLVRVVPSSCVTLLVYENMKAYLSKMPAH